MFNKANKGRDAGKTVTSIGEELRRARLRKGLYMYQVGNHLNLSESCICRYEKNSRNTEIPDDILVKWAFYVGAVQVLKMRCQKCTISKSLEAGGYGPEAA